MVSQLSLRLLSGSSCTSAVNSSEDSKTPTRSTNASTHGYSGDNEAPKGESKQVPSKIDTSNGQSKKRFARAGQESSGKKQKVMARNYAAHTVKHDLSRGDLPYPKICENPRLFSSVGTVVDMSLVSLVPAQEVEASPFLVPITYTSPFETDYWNTMMTSLVSTTSRVYKKSISLATAASSEKLDGQAKNASAPTTSPNDDTYSSASSISDSEEGDGNTAGQEADKGEKSMGMKKTNSKDKSAVINMGNALAISNQARLVVLGFAPYSVVHVNAAYSRITGIPSTTALGQPLHEIFSDDSIATSLQLESQAFPLTDLHLRAIKMNAAKDLPECVVRVSAVGSDADSVTHYVLELETKNPEGNQAIYQQHTDGRIEVMG